MKLLCDTCEQVVPLAQLRHEGGALVFHCPSCGARGRIDASAGEEPSTSAAESAGEAPRLTLIASTTTPLPALEVPSTHCPKCIEPRTDSALACPKCGLVFANFEPSLVAPRPGLVERWRALLCRWEDAAEHERLIRQAAQLGALAELARLYRIRLAHAPKDAQALAARERIIALVASAALPERTEPATAPKNLRPIWYAMLGILALAMVGLLFRMAMR